MGEHTPQPKWNLRRYNYHRVNWAAFQRTVDLNVDQQHPLQTSGDIDAALVQVEAAIAIARQLHVKQTSVVSSPLEIDSTTELFIRLRNIYQRQYQRTGLPEKKLMANQLSRVVLSRILDLRNKDFQRKLSQLPSHSHPFWKLGKILKTKPKPIPPLIQNAVNSDRLITPAEKADALGHHFCSSHNLGQTMLSPREHEVAEAVADRSNLALENQQRVTADEVKAAIKSSKNMKAPGFGNTFNLELKSLSFRLYEHLASIFNRCCQISCFP